MSGTHWLGNVANDPLQRVYGIAFPEKRMLVEWQARQAEVRGPLGCGAPSPPPAVAGDLTRLRHPVAVPRAPPADP